MMYILVAQLAAMRTSTCTCFSLYLCFHGLCQPTCTAVVLPSACLFWCVQLKSPTKIRVSQPASLNAGCTCTTYAPDTRCGILVADKHVAVHDDAAVSPCAHVCLRIHLPAAQEACGVCPQQVQNSRSMLIAHELDVITSNSTPVSW